MCAWAPLQNNGRHGVDVVVSVAVCMQARAKEYNGEDRIYFQSYSQCPDSTPTRLCIRHNVMGTAIKVYYSPSVEKTKAVRESQNQKTSTFLAVFSVNQDPDEENMTPQK